MWIYAKHLVLVRVFVIDLLSQRCIVALSGFHAYVLVSSACVVLSRGLLVEEVLLFDLLIVAVEQVLDEARQRVLVDGLEQVVNQLLALVAVGT